MHYLDIKQGLSDYTVFSLVDINKLDGTFYRPRLNEWQNKGYIIKIVKGYYIFTDTKINDITLYCIANKIYRPSYISLEMALSYYNLIPESVYTLTSVSTKRTYKFNTNIGSFYYRTVKPEFFFGYEIIKENNITYQIADLEKSLLDYLYLNPHFITRNDFSELRINREIFWENIDEQKLNHYIERFAQKKLSTRVKKLLRYLKND